MEYCQREWSVWGCVRQRQACISLDSVPLLLTFLLCTFRDYWGVYECHYSCPDCDPHTTCKGGYTCYNDLAFVEHLVMNILLEELNIDQNR